MEFRKQELLLNIDRLSKDLKFKPNKDIRHLEHYEALMFNVRLEKEKYIHGPKIENLMPVAIAFLAFLVSVLAFREVEQKTIDIIFYIGVGLMCYTGFYFLYQSCKMRKFHKIVLLEQYLNEYFKLIK